MAGKKLKMKIRKATQKDLGDILKLDEELDYFEKKKFDKNIRFAKKTERAQKIIKYFKKNSRIFLAREDDKIIGFAAGRIVKKQRYFGKIGEVNSVLIVEERRGKGIGEALTKELLKWFKFKGVKTVRLFVYSKNNYAQNVYKKIGFGEKLKVMERKL